MKLGDGSRCLVCSADCRFRVRTDSGRPPRTSSSTASSSTACLGRRQRWKRCGRCARTSWRWWRRSAVARQGRRTEGPRWSARGAAARAGRPSAQRPCGACGTSGRRGRSALDEPAAAATHASADESHLRRRLCFGDCLDDEWLAVWLLAEATRRDPRLSVAVADNRRAVPAHRDEPRVGQGPQPLARPRRRVAPGLAPRGRPPHHRRA